MHEEIAIAGFGGQGVLFIGRLLAEAGLLEEREVVWVPSYGGEKRGGTVRCNVIISDEKIGCLFVTDPTAAIAMNPASLVRFEPTMRPRGLLIVNKSLVPSKVSRKDIRVLYVPAIDLAVELGDSSVSNLITLGALVAGCPVVSISSIIAVMGNMLSTNKRRIEMNKQALDKGYTWSQNEEP